MENEKIEILYKILIDGLNLNDDTLISYGLSIDDINILVSSRIIEHNKNNEYKLVVVEKFRRYGVNLMLRQKIKEANICFDICYKLASNGKNICLQVLLAAIRKYDYNKAFEIFSNLEKIQPYKNLLNNNLYLYLLSNITTCPKEYIERAKKLEHKDLILPSLVGNKIENEIRYAIVQNKFTYAYQLINNRTAKEKEYSVKFELIRVMLIQAIENDKKFKSKLIHLAKTEKYFEIFSIIKEKQQQRRLTKLETCILLSIEAIINVSKTNVIPIPTINDTKDMYEALVGNNYKLALSINEEHRNFTGTSNKDDTINILLLKLNSLIKQLEEKQNIKDTLNRNEEKYTDIEEIAYYIASQNITLDIAKKQFGLLHEQLLLIKLIYARDYFIEGNYLLGDKYLQEVKNDKDTTSDVISLLNEVKMKRNEYKNQSKPHTRCLKHN